MSKKNFSIDGQRLWQSFTEMATISPGVSGGNNRQALTEGDGQARHLLQDWLTQIGLETVVDPIGNMFATWHGTEPKLPAVLIGSHLDTQPTGGKYDGVLGVLAGLEVLRTLADHGYRPKRSIVLVNWTNEEGCRFGPAMLGSGVFSGQYTLDWAYAREDSEGKRLGEALAAIGWRGEAEPPYKDIHACIELHIEQGPILERESIPIGIVTHGQGSQWWQFILEGKAAHAGSTPMNVRQNATLGLARLIDIADQAAMRYQPNAVATVGHIEVSPNSRNVIAERVLCSVDFRSPDQQVLRAMEKEICEGVKRAATELDLHLDSQKIGGFAPVEFDTDLLALIRRTADDLGYAHRDIVSGAGHDACWISHKAPSAMIFCPCVDGLSHNEAETIHPEWAKTSAELLFHAALNAAEI